MDRFTPLAIALISLTTIAGCGSKWRPAGEPSAVVEFGHPSGAGWGDGEFSPIPNGVYGPGHPVKFEAYAGAFYDDGTFGIGALVFRTTIRNLDTNETWDGTSWGNHGQVEHCAAFGADCELEHVGSETYAHAEFELMPEDLGNCNCLVTLTAYNTDGGDTESIGRQFTVDLDNPEVTITAPTAGSVSIDNVEIEGTAVTGTESVMLEIIDAGSNEFWNSSSNIFGGANAGPFVSNFNINTGIWTYLFEESNRPGSGRYTVTGRADSLDGHQDTLADAHTIRISTEPPVVYLNDPDEGNPPPSGSVSISFDATDERAVEKVELAIYDTHTEEYWNPSTSQWVGGEIWIDNYASQPDEVFSGGWTWNQVDSGSGQYRVYAQAVDFAGEVSVEPPTSVEFFGAVDGVPPLVTVTLPAAGQVLTRIDDFPTGTANDANSGVVRVTMEIRDVGNGNRYWDISGAQPAWLVPPAAGPAPTFDARLDPATGGNSVTWIADNWDPQTATVNGGSGDYSIQVTAYDAQDNAIQSPVILFDVDNDTIPLP